MDELKYIVTVRIDSVPIHEFIENISINSSEEQYVNDVTISFNKKAEHIFKNLCNPQVNYAKERIYISITDKQTSVKTEFKFLLEKRNSRVQEGVKVYSVWGRTKAALLDLPYSLPYTDIDAEDDDRHPWQKAPISAKSIIEYFLDDLYDRLGIEIFLQFKIDNFTVFPEDFSIESESAISIINKLVQVPGGRVRSDFNGDLIIDYKEYQTEFQATLPTLEITDIDEIIQIDEEIMPAIGYNKVRITGYDELSDLIKKGIQIEAIEDCLERGTPFNIKIYTSPSDLIYEFDTTIGTFYHIGEYTEIHEEVIHFNRDGTGSTRYPITATPQMSWHGRDRGNVTYVLGFKELKSEVEHFGVLTIKYQSTYTKYEVLIQKAGDAILFAEEIPVEL